MEPISWLDLLHSLYRDKVFALLAATPDLGIKQIAQLTPCSTNTARKWKRLFHENKLAENGVNIAG